MGEAAAPPPSPRITRSTESKAWTNMYVSHLHRIAGDPSGRRRTGAAPWRSLLSLYCDRAERHAMGFGRAQREPPMRHWRIAGNATPALQLLLSTRPQPRAPRHGPDRAADGSGSV